MKFLVAQIGARHHYAIPRMLARRGCLEALYTDSSVNAGIGRLLNRTVPQWKREGSVGKLLQRRIAGVPIDRVRSSDVLFWRHLFHREVSGSFSALDRVGQLFSERMIHWGVGGATDVYSMFGEGIEFLRFAKERGLRINVDLFLTPIAHRIVAEERRLFPEWEGEPKPWDERLEPRIRKIIALADILLCPGQNVVEGLSEFGDFSAKVRLVPYGSGMDFGGRVNKPIVGRVLFAGTAELRKGFHYFAAASKHIGTSRCDFRVAGGVTDEIRGLPQCGGLNFLGRISRAEMVHEILSADVLVLPTLAEGSASVVSEALVAGLPVITTSSAGSVISHDRNGILIAERDEEALATGIDRIVTDREFRESLAQGARGSSSFLSEEAWADRLLTELAL